MGKKKTTRFENNQFKAYALKRVCGNFILWGRIIPIMLFYVSFSTHYQNVEHQFAIASTPKLKHAVYAKRQYFGG